LLALIVVTSVCLWAVALFKLALLPVAIFALAVGLWFSADSIAGWIERGARGKWGGPLPNRLGDDEQMLSRSSDRPKPEPE